MLFKLITTYLNIAIVRRSYDNICHQISFIFSVKVMDCLMNIHMDMFFWRIWVELFFAVNVQSSIWTGSMASVQHGYLPGELVFQRDMLMHCRIVTDWGHVKRSKWSQAKKANEWENRARIAHKYSVGDLVLLLRHQHDVHRKLDQPTDRPFKVLWVNKNGTICIRRGGYQETVSIRQIKPYVESIEQSHWFVHNH